MARTRTEVLFYARPQQIEADGCFAITFIRPTGTNDVMINGYSLADGQSLQIQQNVGDTDQSTYDIVFYDIGNNNNLTIIKIMPE
jgi:uncharacterized protein YfaP (DUF2135 family)